MVYYIDFDCTLYDTEKLIDEMINRLATALSKNNNYNEVLSFLSYEFKVNRIPDVFGFCQSLANKYNANVQDLIDLIVSILNDGKRFVYEDAISFLKSKQNDKIKLLTYTKEESTKYQKLKIKGSGLEDFFDEIIITSKSKGELDIDYSSGIFIDDSPKSIVEIYAKNPLKIIRINRENSSYSKLKLPENIIVPEFKTLLDINWFWRTNAT